MFCPETNSTAPKITRQALEKVADVFCLLAEPTLLAILQELKSGPKTVGALVENLRLSQANVSKQLKIMLDGGVLGRGKTGSPFGIRLTTKWPFVCARWFVSALTSARVPRAGGAGVSFKIRNPTMQDRLKSLLSKLERRREATRQTPNIKYGAGIETDGKLLLPYSLLE